MNPKTIIASIEQNRAVIEAQVERLSAFSGATVTPKLDPDDPRGSVISLLGQTMQGHLQGAADALRTLGEVEANLRRSFTGSSPRSAVHEPGVIEGKAVVVDSDPPQPPPER